MEDKHTGKWKWRINLHTLHDSQHEVTGFPNMDNKKFGGRTMFIGSTLSHRLQPEYANTIPKYFTKWILHMLEGGHFLYAEKPEIVSTMIANFISYRPSSKDVK